MREVFTLAGHRWDRRLDRRLAGRRGLILRRGRISNIRCAGRLGWSGLVYRLVGLFGRRGGISGRWLCIAGHRRRDRRLGWTHRLIASTTTLY